MQTQHLIIIVTCTTIVLLLMGYYIRKLLLQAFDRHYEAGIRDHQIKHGGRIAALNADITHLTRTSQEADERHQREMRALKADHLAALSQQTASTFNETDHQFLMQVHGTLILAKHTWRAIPGTEPYQVKAERQAETVLELASRIHVAQGAAA